ncbi:NUDIX hydrolase [Candidatus Daviesbacteria bacterium]|nr:NUDIX hydrolase [Candidatus Daviesbacteria bacterium]
MINCTFEDGGQTSLRHVTVDVLVLKNHQILLVKRVGKLIEGGKWGLAGGFVERDETLEQAVERETMEETGWQVEDIKLLKVNDSPTRPKEDRQNISFIFTCRAVKRTAKSDWESEQIKWFSLNKLPAKEEVAFDHYDNIAYYLQSLA